MVIKDPTEQLLRTLSDFLRQEDIDLNRGLLVAVSGGTDSTALLTLLASYRSSPGSPSFPLYGLYVDHCLREEDEAESEWQQLQAVCRQFMVPITRISLGDGKVKAEAKNSGEGIESAARKLRYQSLEVERQRLDCAYVALGHTLDDLTETMVTRFMQGVGISGLHGIPPCRGSIIRPLLAVKKENLAAYLSYRGISHSEDSSNLLPLYQRNRVRSRIIPVLLDEFPNAADLLYKTSKIHREENELLEELTSSRLPWKLREDRASIAAAKFLSAPESLQVRSLLQLINHYLPGTGRVSRDFLSSIRKPQQGGEAVVLSGRGFTLKKIGRYLEFIPSVVFNGKRRYVRRVHWGIDGYVDQLKFSWHREDGSDEGNIFLPEVLSSELILLRSVRLSDQLKTECGTKRVAEIFSDQRIPVSLRDSIPVLQVSDRPAAVFGSLYGYKDRIAAEFRAHSKRDHGMILRIERVE